MSRLIDPRTGAHIQSRRRPRAYALTGARGEAGDGHDVAGQRVEEAGTDGGADVADVHREARGHALGRGVAREAGDMGGGVSQGRRGQDGRTDATPPVLRLGDADGEVRVARRGVRRDLLLRRLRVGHAVALSGTTRCMKDSVAVSKRAAMRSVPQIQ